MNDFNLQAPWVGNPPDEEEPVCECARCGCPLYEDSEAYKLEGDIVCEECAEEYLAERKVNLEK